VLEYPIKADFALIKAHQGDRWGNLVSQSGAQLRPDYGDRRKNHHRFAAGELGDLDPENIITPGIFVQRVLAGKPDCRTTRLRSQLCKN
jgi:3-oxoadipate CoA-transferase alpha subunit